MAWFSEVTKLCVSFASRKGIEYPTNLKLVKCLSSLYSARGGIHDL
jgi:hypothetical protein